MVKTIPEARFLAAFMQQRAETTPKEHCRQAEKQRNIPISRGFLGVNPVFAALQYAKGESHF
jgi:hypothetical protein